MSLPDVYILGGARTPFGKFGGAFTDSSVADLALAPTEAALARSGCDPDDVDHLVFGNVLQTTSDAVFASRAVALRSGMRIETACLNVNRACGTGLQAITSVAEQIQTGRSSIGVAAGAENFSAAPHAIRSRWGTKRGVPLVEDMLDWAYRDPFGGQLMGETAEALSDRSGIGRERQDAYGLTSQQRTAVAAKNGFFDDEIVEMAGIRVDEFPRPHVTREALRGLPAPFGGDARVTAGNSSGINDGGAAVVVASGEAVSQHGLEPWGRLVDWAWVGVEPELMGRGPVPASRLIFERNGIDADDLDVAEVNEAFAVVVLHAIDELGLDPDWVNPNGGAIAIGHPPGATGLRMVITALNHLARTGGRLGLVTLCLGGGQGMAMLLENLRR